MKYLCLVYGEESKIKDLRDDECVAYDQALRHRGQCIASEALQPVQTAATVRVRDGKVSVTDGPFAETKEQLAGFYMVDARRAEWRAIQIASKIPPARVGCVEVRPIRDLAGRDNRSLTRPDLFRKSKISVEIAAYVQRPETTSPPRHRIETVLRD